MDFDGRGGSCCWGEGLTRKERDRMESVMVRKYILVMVWNGLLGS